MTPTVHRQRMGLMRNAFGWLDNPHLMRRLTATLILVSVVEWVAATIFGWVNLVSYVSHLSQLAITISLIPWWQGLRVESRQVEEDIPNEVVEKIVENTDVNHSGAAQVADTGS